MTKILIIMASPRKESNTAILLREFMRGTEESNAEIEQVNLYDKDISGCREIYACQKTGRCIIKDDFDEIYDKLEQCDKLVIATPIFFYGPPAPLKALIDRTQAFYMRKHHLKNPILADGEPKRPAYLLALGATNGEKLFDPTLLMLKICLANMDMKLKETLLYRSIEKKADILNHPQALQEAYELGVKVGAIPHA
jgi:multimeric flavodoxin WrbA